MLICKSFFLVVLFHEVSLLPAMIYLNKNKDYYVTFL